MSQKDHHLLKHTTKRVNELEALVETLTEQVAMLSERVNENLSDRDNPPKLPKVRKNGAGQPKTAAS